MKESEEQYDDEFLQRSLRIFHIGHFACGRCVRCDKIILIEQAFISAVAPPAGGTTALKSPNYQNYQTERIYHPRTQRT
jgi:hypothetical protein